MRASVIDHGSVSDAWQVAYHTQNKRLDQLQQMVVERGEPIDAVYFAERIDGAGIHVLQHNVMNADNMHTTYPFACIQKDGVDMHA